MSLRKQIHSAFDEVAPPTFGIPERVVQTVLAEGPSRRRRERMMLRLRVPLSMVAVFVAIALVVGVLIGGRLMQDWNSFRNSAPAGGGQTQLAQLESRPLVLPTPASYFDCKSGPYNKAGSLGKGPVYGDGGGTSSTSWGIYYHNLAYAETDITGLILVRAKDLFTHNPVVFVGQHAAGPLVGQDTVDGVAVEQHTELVFDTNQASTSPSTHKFAWPFIAGVPHTWSGSTGWQIDGVGFSEVFVAC
ncbi:MAG TPA: hypothetical protein VF956_12010 [Candidatus Dormibacteraeota bacterium]